MPGRSTSSRSSRHRSHRRKSGRDRSRSRDRRKHDRKRRSSKKSRRKHTTRDRKEEESPTRSQEPSRNVPLDSSSSESSESEAEARPKAVQALPTSFEEPRAILQTLLAQMPALRPELRSIFKALDNETSVDVNGLQDADIRSALFALLLSAGLDLSDEEGFSRSRAHLSLGPLSQLLGLDQPVPQSGADDTNDDSDNDDGGFGPQLGPQGTPGSGPGRVLTAAEKAEAWERSRTMEAALHPTSASASASSSAAGSGLLQQRHAQDPAGREAWMLEPPTAAAAGGGGIGGLFASSSATGRSGKSDEAVHAWTARPGDEPAPKPKRDPKSFLGPVRRAASDHTAERAAKRERDARLAATARSADELAKQKRQSSAILASVGKPASAGSSFWDYDKFMGIGKLSTKKPMGLGSAVQGVGDLSSRFQAAERG